MSVIERPDLPYRGGMRVWHCELCEAIACEFTSDDGTEPDRCPIGKAPEWRAGR